MERAAERATLVPQQLSIFSVLGTSDLRSFKGLPFFPLALSMTSSISTEQRHKLIAAAQEARKLSYSPYSKFRVGAAILCKDGEIILGANIENASYGGAICAERTALVKGMTSGQSSGSFIAIAVSSDLDGTCSPCGICRQFIRELCLLDTPIYMCNSSWTTSNDKEDSTVVTRTLEQLLPLSFGPEDLDRPRS